jgi:hypothetical protein
MYRKNAAAVPSDSITKSQAAISREIESLRRQVKKSSSQNGGSGGAGVDTSAMFTEILNLTKKMGDIQVAQSKEIAQQVMSQLSSSSASASTSSPRLRYQGRSPRQGPASHERSERSMLKDALSIILESDASSSPTRNNNNSQTTLSLIEQNSNTEYNLQIAKREKVG